MLTINIVKGYPNGTLDFEVDGKSNKGHSKAEKGEEVKWKVKHKSVKSISAIKLKPGTFPGGNTDIFSQHKPAAEPSGKKNWKAEVNDDAEVCDAYHYDIMWVDEFDNPQTCDPIISIKPSTLVTFRLLPMIFGAIVSVFMLNFLFRKLRKK